MTSVDIDNLLSYYYKDVCCSLTLLDKENRRVAYNSCLELTNQIQGNWIKRQNGKPFLVGTQILRYL